MKLYMTESRVEDSASKHKYYKKSTCLSVCLSVHKKLKKLLILHSSFQYFNSEHRYYTNKSSTDDGVDTETYRWTILYSFLLV